LGHHQAGRLAQAEDLYRLTLAADAGNADAPHLLGVLAYQTGRHEMAVDMIGRAISANPAVADFHGNLGNALHALGRLDEAAAAYRAALALAPGSASALSNLGETLRKLGDLGGAEANCRQAVAVDPGFAMAHNNLGNVLTEMDRHDAAAACYRAALAIAPDYAEAHGNLGSALTRLGRLNEAAAAYRQSVTLRPAFPEAWRNLAAALKALDRLDEAAECCRRAIEQKPAFAEAHVEMSVIQLLRGDFGEAVAAARRAVALRPDDAGTHVQLGAALTSAYDLDGALAACRQALALSPDHAAAWTNIGLVLRLLGRADEAIAACRRSVALDPGAGEGHRNLALALLLKGDYEEGWIEYEWRQSLESTRFSHPRWAGQDLAGRRLLVWGEQGIGDELAFFGILPEVLERGARCTVECDPRLVPLLRRSLPDVAVAARTAPPDPRCVAADIDFQAPAGSVVAALRPALASFRPLAPYLVADAATTAELRRRYRGGAGTALVGISWRTRHPTLGPVFSAPLADWLPLARIPGIRLVSLQYGDCRDEIAAAGFDLAVDPQVDPLVDLDRFAAQVAAMDLVVSIDNSTVSMSTALGRPVWNLLSFAPDWRMGLAGDTSPWHATMRCFRQPSRGDWHSVFADVARRLPTWLDAWRAGSAGGSRSGEQA
jgi:tetratricopeptide (TPR) repeat protein